VGVMDRVEAKHVSLAPNAPIPMSGTCNVRSHAVGNFDSRYIVHNKSRVRIQLSKIE